VIAEVTGSHGAYNSGYGVEAQEPDAVQTLTGLAHIGSCQIAAVTRELAGEPQRPFPEEFNMKVPIEQIYESYVRYCASVGHTAPSMWQWQLLTALRVKQ
jgi:hypothetical protein